MAHRPLVIAHRGFSARYPENTLAAIDAAIEAEADMVEIDVQETRDGQVVVFHDYQLQRLCRLRDRISNVTYDRLCRHKTDVPTLADVLRHIRNRCPLLLEMKRVDPAKVVAEIESAKMVEQVTVFAFAVPLLQEVQRLNGQIRCFGLTGDDLSHSVRTIQSAIRIQGIGVASRLLRSKADVQQLRKRVGSVFVWTVNQASRMRELAHWGVDGVITNHPDRAVEVFSAKSP